MIILLKIKIKYPKKKQTMYDYEKDLEKRVRNNQTNN